MSMILDAMTRRLRAMDKIGDDESVDSFEEDQGEWNTCGYGTCAYQDDTTVDYRIARSDGSFWTVTLVEDLGHTIRELDAYTE